MNVNIIQTGSDGNCTIINNDFMLDCGVSYSKVKQYLRDIKFIFVSHAHSDHLCKSTIKKIAYEYPNIKFIVGEKLVDDLLKCNVEKKNIFALKINKNYMLNQYTVHLDDLIHDVPNCAISIWNIETNEKIIYATDTSSIDHVKAENYDLALIEANYETDDVLIEKIKEAEEKGEFTHLRRVLKTHLSQLDAFNWIQKNKINNYHFMHEHKEKEENNENIKNKDL